MPTELQDVKRVVVYLSRWLHGGYLRDRPDVGPCLHHAKVDRMCCLGFACLQAGVPLEDLTGTYYPKNLNMVVPGFSEKDPDGKLQNTVLSELAAGINDDLTISLAERMKRLRELFRGFGREIVFTGAAPTKKFHVWLRTQGSDALWDAHVEASDAATAEAPDGSPAVAAACSGCKEYEE